MVRYRRERHSENADAEKEYDRTKTEPGTKRADDPKKHPDHGGHYEKNPAGGLFLSAAGLLFAIF